MAEKSIEVFQELFLRGAPAASIRKSILSLVYGPWRHEVEREEDLRHNAGGEDDDVIVLARDAFDDIDESGLVLWQKKDSYWVSNIVPRNVGELGITKYNLILRDFAARIAKPAAQAGGFAVELTLSDKTLDDWLASEPADELRRFSKLANKSTGASHPMDRERWFNFLISAHKTAKRPDPEQLARWLVEVDGWPGERARELAIDYEFALGLLERYDQSC